MRVLYIEDEINIAEIYMVMIKDRYPQSIISHYENGLKALQDLKLKPESFDLIISDFSLPNISGGDIFSFVSGQMLGIPFIILSGLDCSNDPNFKNFFTSHVRNAFLLKPVSIADLTEKIEWCLAGEDDLLKIYEQPIQNFDEKIAIRSDTFLKINMVPCDIYLKLNDGKFIKIINKNELFGSHLIQKLIMKGVASFFVNRSELSAYGESVVDALHSLLKTKKHKPDEQKSQLANKAIELLRGNLLKCGFNSSILGVADEVTNMQIEMINANPDLVDFLNKFQNFRKMNTEHTRLVSYLIVGILKELGWDSESTLQKMCTAALLHDISLPDEINNKVIKDSGITKLQDEEKSIFLRHPEESSHIAKNFDSIATGIGQYIKEHHELPNGKGFPNKMNYNSVHPLSATLHLADLTAELLWKHEFDVNVVKDEIGKLRNLYLHGFYRKPYEALIKSLKSCKT